MNVIIGTLETGEGYAINDVTPENAKEVASHLDGMVNRDNEVIINKVRFPKSRQYANRETWESACLMGCAEETVVVQRIVTLSSEALNRFVDDMKARLVYKYLQDIANSTLHREFIGIGGNNISPSREKDLGWERISSIDILKDREMFMTYNEHVRTKVVVLEWNSKRLFVNCEGYDYALHVGFK